MATDERTRIRVVPHFPRLQEWIALEEGYFRDEGLEPELLTDMMHAVSGHRGDPYGERPQDLPFVRQAPVANSACEWGTACNAGAGLGRLVPDLYTVGRHALFARPGSPIRRLADLRDVPVGVGLMAGSHFTALAALAQALPPEGIRVVHTGGPGQRLLALLAGEVEAANLLDPEIPIAEARGLRKLAQGEFRITFWVGANIDPAALAAYFRALRRADEALARTPERYMPLWARNVPPALAGDYDYATFGLGEKLVFEPYTEAMFREAMAFARRWGLDANVREDRYAHLLAPAGA
jgi:ABC-type nitrate/sulfonate/bicarbonate transport system substrate-binding protein